MLRCNALTRVAAGAVQASSNKHVAHLTRTLNHLSLSSKLAPVSVCSNPLARTFATKVVKKKPATKARAKTPAKKKTAAKPAAKTKSKAKSKTKAPAAKKKAPARKAVKKKKVVAKPKKKVPSEAQKLKASNAKAKAEITNLKKTALIGTAPKFLPDSAWTVFVAEKATGSSSARDRMKDASAEYKALSAPELEHYNHIANQNKTANEKAYSAWVNSHTPEQIRVANAARNLLKRRLAAGAYSTRKGMKGLIKKIKDERQPKRPMSAYLAFSMDRRASGDFKNITLLESAKLITDEWKALSPAETKKYTDLQEANKARYAREYQTIYGHPAPKVSTAAA
ncbi:hypothetical protein FKW77_004505 [Venturia effusa]|uniref:HMG box domain-containing protein n=1 Tax=Venturia effusa TaxID=50376 RepID=A0A517LFB3_9PEZI|nr:hypothetical protein FKW77_004505 [Venturia effusa]